MMRPRISHSGCAIYVLNGSRNLPIMPLCSACVDGRCAACCEAPVLVSGSGSAQGNQGDFRGSSQTQREACPQPGAVADIQLHITDLIQATYIAIIGHLHNFVHTHNMATMRMS